MCCTIGNILTSLIEGFASHFYVYVSRHHFYFFSSAVVRLINFPPPALLCLYISDSRSERGEGKMKCTLWRTLQFPPLPRA